MLFLEQLKQTIARKENQASGFRFLDKSPDLYEHPRNHCPISRRIFPPVPCGCQPCWIMTHSSAGLPGVRHHGTSAGYSLTDDVCRLCDARDVPYNRINTVRQPDGRHKGHHQTHVTGIRLPGRQSSGIHCLTSAAMSCIRSKCR